MIDPYEQQRERLELLLAERAVGALAKEDLPELHALLEKFPDVDPEEHERAAAAFGLAMLPESEDHLPQNLRDKILAGAPQHLSENRPDSSTPNASLRNGSSQTPTLYRSTRTAQASADPSLTEQFLPSRRDTGGWWRLGTVTGWAATAAAILLLLSPLRNNPSPAEQAVSLAEQRQTLLDLPGTLRLEWQSGKHPFDSPVRGNVVWNQNAQRGFMTFEGMPVNDPSLQQYQLWIIDPERDAEPIDGGVFDIDQQGRVTIPIDAKLATISPQAFAITIEKPGGVVVSTQDRLPLLAVIQ